MLLQTLVFILAAGFFLGAYSITVVAIDQNRNRRMPENDYCQWSLEQVEPSDN